MGFIETDAQVLGKAWSRMAHHAGGFQSRELAKPARLL
jgi:hypothetical protein